MTNIEAVQKVLENYGCQDIYAIANDAKRLFGYEITPASAGAAARKMEKQGLVGSSKNEKGRTIYWLNKDFQYKWDK